MNPMISLELPFIFQGAKPSLDFPFSLSSQKLPLILGEKNLENVIFQWLSQRVQMLIFGIKSQILMIFPLFFFLPTEQPTATLLLRRAFPNRFPGNSYPKLHHPSLFSQYYPAFFWNHNSSFPHGGEGLEQPQKSPGASNSKEFGIFWEWQILCYSRRGGFCSLILSGNPKSKGFWGIWGTSASSFASGWVDMAQIRSEFQDLMDPGGIYSLPRDFANTSCALG